MKHLLKTALTIGAMLYVASYLQTEAERLGAELLGPLLRPPAPPDPAEVPYDAESAADGEEPTPEAWAIRDPDLVDPAEPSGD